MEVLLKIGEDKSLADQEESSNTDEKFEGYLDNDRCESRESETRFERDSQHSKRFSSTRSNQIELSARFLTSINRNLENIGECDVVSLS